MPTGNLTTPVPGAIKHTATLLPNGKVLVPGGGGQNGGTPLISAELYDPASGIVGVQTRQPHNRTRLSHGDAGAA